MSIGLRSLNLHLEKNTKNFIFETIGTAYRSLDKGLRNAVKGQTTREKKCLISHSWHLAKPNIIWYVSESIWAVITKCH